MEEVSLLWRVSLSESAPDGHHGGTKGHSERELDGYGPIALVGAAAGLCDGVAGCQDATSGCGVAESCGQATLALEIHHVSGIEH